jgi:two-component system OmpR family sensor kinase
VSDNGKGIEASLQDDIFKPFIRGNHGSDVPKGHGIGLAVVKRIIDWHRGSITVDRCDTLSGAKFTVSLPKT